MFKIESHVNGKVSNQVDSLLRELATVRAESKRLHDTLHSRTRGSAIVRRAVVDAHAILLAAFGDASTSQKAMQRGGMSRRRWGWAVAFLRYAGIVSTSARKWRSGLEFVVRELTECITLLEKCANELMGQAAGYSVLSSYLRDV